MRAIGQSQPAALPQVSYAMLGQLIVQESLVDIAMINASIHLSPDQDAVLHCNQSMENPFESVRADSIDTAQVVGSKMRIDQLEIRYGIAWQC